MRAESHNAHSKENAYNTLGYKFFYLYRYFYCKCTVKWIAEIDVEGYICTAKTSFFKMRIWSSQW